MDILPVAVLKYPVDFKIKTKTDVEYFMRRVVCKNSRFEMDDLNQKDLHIEIERHNGKNAYSIITMPSTSRLCTGEFDSEAAMLYFSRKTINQKFLISLCGVFVDRYIDSFSVYVVTPKKKNIWGSLYVFDKQDDAISFANEAAAEWKVPVFFAKALQR